ncbi:MULTISPECIES: type I restriction enzyme HsdR N-terminal domain-containing protein [unclassified Caulobacter]|uniref:type I restriction enzyme HsdR N-terminal domain-containing protein n=1 Tax=unclassified Caulobacter TaxID=2648921 RepID=UPI001304BD43|nr:MULTISPECIES: type I restriction enzyme HsdR N-terminal domain-containing protein [unclassified Caulobacter]
MPKFEDMNETDVREVIVRPLLQRLGYAHGTEAAIRTEQTFRYGKAFLGRKSPKKDPELVGRADYILEVASFGRWVVEVKAPGEDITRDTVEQAHTYAAHPEVAALYFLVTNGRKFQLYRTSSLDAPLMAWSFEDGEEIFLALSNLVSPDAIKRKVRLLVPDGGKPLGAGLPSSVQIIGGFVRYEDHVGNHPLLNMDGINGLELPITSGRVSRAEDGRLHAALNMAKAAPMMGEVNALLKREDDYDFYCGDEYISTIRNRPSIFQNFFESHTPAGTPIAVMGLGKTPMPFGFRMSALTEAVGYVEDDVFKGTMQISYEMIYEKIPPFIRQALEAQLGPIPAQPKIQGGGQFEVKLLRL